MPLIGIIVGTFYRLPQLLGELFAKLSASALKTDPILSVNSCHMEFPEIGGPLVNIEMLNVTDGDGHGSIKWNFDLSKDILLTIPQHGKLWDDAAQVFGSVLVSFVRGFLPLKLIDGTSVGWTEFVSEYTENSLHDQTVRETIQETQTAFVNASSSLWIRLDLGKVKRSTIYKKLKLLPSMTQVCLQIETVASPIGGDEMSKCVLCRMCPTVGNLVSIIESDMHSGLIPSSALNIPRFSSNTSPVENLAERKNNFVNSFYLITAKVFAEILIDLVCLLCFLGSVLSPMRFIQMVYVLIEPEHWFPVHLAEKCLRMVGHIDNHLLEYRKAISYPFNLFVKSRLSNFASISNGFFPNEAPQRVQLVNAISMSMRDTSDTLKIAKQIDSYHLKPYRSARKRLAKGLSKVSECSQLSTLFDERMRLHDELIVAWKNCTAADLLLRASYVEDVRYSLVISLLSEEYEKIAAQLSKNSVAMKRSLMQLEESAKQKDTETNKKKKHCICLRNLGIFHRPIMETRLVIGMTFIQVLFDIGFVLLLAILLLTIARAIPLVRELVAKRSFLPMRYTTRTILKRHARLLGLDLFHICKFFGCSLVVVATVGGIPNFLADLSSSLSSYYSAAKCAEDHAKKCLKYLCEVLLLVGAFRTYRVLFKSCLYVFIIPGACLAETLPHWFSSGIRISVGILVWIGLFIGSVLVSRAAKDAKHSSSDALSATSALFYMSIVLIGSLLFCALSVFNRKIYQSPGNNPSHTVLKFTWSHFLALLTGPMESLQLSAIVMYFFWNKYDSNKADFNLGTDRYSSSVLSWCRDGGDYQGYSIAVNIAVLTVFIWGMIVSIPLAIGGLSASTHKRQKVMHFQLSPAVETIKVIISRLLTVWIIATLMRSSSCVGSNGESLLSTATTVQCGGYTDGNGNNAVGSWAGQASIPLLTFFVITSTILHADDADLLLNSLTVSNDTNLEKHINRYVKFAPLYALGMRLLQLFVCGICMVFFRADDISIPLAIVICSGIVGAALQQLLGLKQASNYFGAEMFRTVGMLCLSWTAVVCLIRAHEENEVITSEYAVYIGWVTLMFAGLLVSVRHESKRHKRWQAQLNDSGMLESLKSTVILLESATIEKAFVVKTSADCLNSTDQSHELRIKLSRCSCAADLAKLLVELEESILAFRQSTDFVCKKRAVWLKQLNEVITQPEYDQLVINSSSRRENVNDFDAALSINSFLEDDHLPDLPTDSTIQSLTAIPDIENNADRKKQITFVFQTVIRSANELAASILSDPSKTLLSKQLLTVLLSQRLPREVCWEVIDYLVYSVEMKSVLSINNASKEKLQQIGYYSCSNTKKPQLTDCFDSFYSTFQYSLFFVMERLERIHTCKIDYIGDH